MAGPYNYYLGPWVWDASQPNRPHWRAPAGSVGLIDLRSIPTQSLAETLGDKPVGFFAVAGTLPSEFTLLGSGDLREIASTAAIKSAWRSLVGYEPDGDTLVDLLFDHFTAGSDPSGDSQTPPLMPTVAGNLDLHLGSHALVKRERFVYGQHPHTSQVQAVLHRSYRRLRAEIEAGRTRANHDRRVLDFWLDKYRISKTNPAEWKRLVPPELRGRHPGPLPHQTTITESFNTADGDTLGPDLSWTETNGDFDIVSNRAENIAVDENAARADSDLSSSDHWADIRVVSASGEGAGSCVRFESASQFDYYTGRSNANVVINAWQLHKKVNTVFTLLGVNSTGWATPANNVIRTKADGSTISLLEDGGEKLSVTDSAISGNTRTGIHGWGSSAHPMDNFQAADLAVPPPPLPVSAATPIQTETGSFLYTVPIHTVSTSDTLTGPWTQRDYLYCNTLNREVGPDVDRATFVFDYGSIQRKGETDFQDDLPLSLNDKFVRIQVTDPVDPVNNFVWYGVLKVDARNVHGSGLGITALAKGQQILTAFGLLQLLERTTVNSAVVRNPDPAGAPTITLGRGLSFNDDEHGQYSLRGNQSLSTDSDNVYVFADLPRGREIWTAYTAAEYLLKKHDPRDVGNNHLATWILFGDKQLIDWYDIHVETDGKTVKQILDQLIDRRRGVGYWVDYEPVSNTVEIRLFNFLEAGIVLPGGQVIPANPNQKSLDFELAVDIKKAEVRNSLLSHFHKVVVQGERVTSTFTMRFLDAVEEFKNDWTSADDLLYRNAASASAGYGALDNSQQARKNAVFRGSDQVRHVYRRFKLSELWNQLAPNLELGTVELADPDAKPIWIPGLKLAKFLPLKDRWDYSGSNIQNGTYKIVTDSEPEYLAPLFFAPIYVDVIGIQWEQLDKLSETAPLERDARRWSVRAKILDSAPAVDLEVTGGPQQFIADADFNTTNAATFDTEHDPAKHGGLDWELFHGTITILLDRRVEESRVISAPNPGIQERILYLRIKNARLDYVVPGTVVQIKDGKLVYATDGGYVNDDRDRLKNIARVAAEWYGRTRQTLEVRFKQIRPLVELGDLITDVGGTYNLTGVNTVVTAIAYDFKSVITTFETAYSQFDFL